MNEVLARASRVLGRKVNPASFATNRDVQVGVFVANHVHLVALERAGVRADVSLGLSLGEYNHLVHIGALSLRRRARARRRARRRLRRRPARRDGVGLPAPDRLAARCDRQGARDGPLDVVNFNSPLQHVISGAREAVHAACDALDEDGRRRASSSRSASRCTRRCSRPSRTRSRGSSSARRGVRRAFRTCPNVTGRFEPAATPTRIAHLLTLHVFPPVLWRESIELVTRRLPGVVFVEVGPRTVLFNLLTRSWIRNARFATDGRHEDLAELSQEIRHAA